MRTSLPFSNFGRRKLALIIVSFVISASAVFTFAGGTAGASMGLSPTIPAKAVKTASKPSTNKSTKDPKATTAKPAATTTTPQTECDFNGCQTDEVSVQSSNVLHQALLTQPKTIQGLEMYQNLVLVTLKGKAQKQYQVNTFTGLKALAKSKHVPVVVDSTSGGGVTTFLPMIIFMALAAAAVILIIRISRRRNRRMQENDDGFSPQATQPAMSSMRAGPPVHFSKKELETLEQQEQKEVTVSTVTFADVIGLLQAKDECQNLVWWLKNGYLLPAIDARVPKGIVLAGPPGTGKTLLARAIAGEAGVPFFSIAGSDFNEKFVGVGAQRVRKIFADARKAGPSIIYIDEIDVIGHSREDNTAGGSGSEDKKTITALLNEMDGFTESNVIVIASTNFYERLDEGLLRPGRFDVKVKLTLPKEEDRLRLFEFYLRNKPVVPNLDLALAVKRTAGMSGAAIANICNRSALAIGRTLGALVDDHVATNSDALDQIVLPEPESTVAKPSRFAIRFSREKRRQRKAEVAKAEQAESPEALLQRKKHHLATHFIRRGHAITSEILLDAIATQVKEQAKKSEASRYQQIGDPVLFDDFIGQTEAKEQFEDIVDYLANPEEYKVHNARIPSGVLLSGPPGEGKTLLARAVAGEADVPFFSITGSSFDQGIVGDGAKAVRALFEEARACAPSIIFIDEVEIVAQKRGSTHYSGAHHQTLTQLIASMDGFDPQEEPVIVMAATNIPDSLDPAFLRAGRMDRKVTLYTPDKKVRVKLFEYYIGKKIRNLADDVDFAICANNSPGLSASAIENVVNESILIQKRWNTEAGLPKNAPVVVTAKAIDRAITQESMGGAQRKSRVMSDKEKLNVAVHEGGHAGVHHVESGGELIARITIMPYGDSGGHVQPIDKDQLIPPREELLQKISMCLGGRVSQEVILGISDAGASSDFKQARRIAYAMVAEYGMTELGPIPAIDGVDRSPAEAAMIENKMREIISECEQRTRMIIEQNRHRIMRIVEVLLEEETILGPEFKALWESCDDVAPEPETTTAVEVIEAPVAVTAQAPLFDDYAIPATPSPAVPAAVPPAPRGLTPARPTKPPRRSLRPRAGKWAAGQLSDLAKRLHPEHEQEPAEA